MQIEHMLVKNIIPYVNNAKEHPKHQIEQIVRSIREFGFNDPIAIDENNVVIEGHGRLEALKIMGIDSVDCIRLSHLNDQQKRAYIIAHNKLTMNTGFNMDIITDELDFLTTHDFDTTLTGFDTDELADILHEEKEVVEDDFDTTPPEVAKSKLGDLWILGRHKLLCGDSTTDDVDRLMDGKKADMCFTDPPYGVDYKGIKNDNKDGLFNLLDLSFGKISEYTKKGGAIYCFHADRTSNIFHEAFRKYFHFSSMIIWVKNSLVLSQTDYQSIHEPCMYGWVDKGNHQWYSDRKQKSVWQYERKSIDGHTTPKPVLLVANGLNNSSKSEDIIIDLFGGSGSTLIAAEQVGRICYMMELDEKYVDVIVNRYREFTDDENIKLIRDGVEYTYAEIMEDV